MGAAGASAEGIAGERRQLLNVAYRLLGSVAESEDAVQEAFARWYALPRSRQDEIVSPGAWLTTVTGRICLDVLGSARARRERYVGAWLPDPLPGHAALNPGPGRSAAPASTDPADQLVLDESVTMAFLVVLESMTPAERVAFVLHDVFRYPFAEIAGILGRTPRPANSSRPPPDGGCAPHGRPCRRPAGPKRCGRSRRRGRPRTSRPSSTSSTRPP